MQPSQEPAPRNDRIDQNSEPAKLPACEPTRDYTATYAALAKMLAPQTKVVLEPQDELPGATIRHLAPWSSDTKWMKITIGKADAPTLLTHVIGFDQLEGLISDKGEFLVRGAVMVEVMKHGFDESFTEKLRERVRCLNNPRAIPIQDASPDAKRLIEQAIENCAFRFASGELKPEIIVTAAPPTAEERAEQARIAKEINDAIAEEKRGRGR